MNHFSSVISTLYQFMKCLWCAETCIFFSKYYLLCLHLRPFCLLPVWKHVAYLLLFTLWCYSDTIFILDFKCEDFALFTSTHLHCLIFGSVQFLLAFPLPFIPFFPFQSSLVRGSFWRSAPNSRWCIPLVLMQSRARTQCWVLLELWLFAAFSFTGRNILPP